MGLVLFDLDNTLVDRDQVFRRWAVDFAARHDLGSDSVDWICDTDARGLATREHLFEAMRARFELETTVEKLLAEYRPNLLPFFETQPEAISAIRRLQADGWKIGVVTNGPPSQHDKLERIGVADLLDACCISELVGCEKPHPAIFHEAAARCGVALQGWMVGDLPDTDIEGARRVGLHTIWLPRGQPWPPHHKEPDGIASSLQDAVNIITRTPIGT